MNKKNIFYLFIAMTCWTSLVGAESQLPRPEMKQTLTAVYQQVKPLQGGKNAHYIPELGKVNPALFGIAVATLDGNILTVGDADVPFAIESITKPFIYALALMDNGEQALAEKVGFDNTGQKFNSTLAIEISPDHFQNPFVNAGAIQVSSLIKGKNPTDKWQREFAFMQQLTDGKLSLNEKLFHSEMATNQHNRANTELMAAYGLMYGPYDDALVRYTQSCSVMVSARQLAMMGATLANDGINPWTHHRIIPSRYVSMVLAEMVVNGLYEQSGSWLVNVGIPTKSGVGGALLGIVPHQMAIVAFSPPIDESGTTLRGRKALEMLSQKWKLSLL